MNARWRRLRRWLAATMTMAWVCSAMTAAAEQFPVVVEAEARAILAAERAGVLSDLKVDVGNRVKAGDALGMVSHKNLSLQKELHQASSEYLHVQVENLTRLNAKGLAADEELKKVATELAVNGKQIEMVEEEIQRSGIRAPFSGVIVDRKVRPHEWVTPGQPVLELYDPTRLRVVGDLPADVAVRLKIGQKHQFHFSDIQKDLTGTLTMFAPQVEVRSNTVKIFWSVPADAYQSSRLVPGMKGVITIEP